MKNLLIVVVTTLFILSCGENKMEKEAKKLAELTAQLNELASSGQGNSAESQAIALATETKSFMEEIKKKYSTEDQLKFAELYKKAMGEVSSSSTKKTDNLVKENSAENKKPEEDPTTAKLVNDTKAIIESNYFTKTLGTAGMIGINFYGDKFSFRVLALNGAELCKANGTYQILPAIDESIAIIKLFPIGPIQKSPAYSDNRGIDTELFLHFNQELLLKRPTKELLSHFGLTDLMTMEGDMPKYFLIGRDAFSSNRIPTQAEKDSIANEERIKEEKKRELEEKLKGL